MRKLAAHFHTRAPALLTRDGRRKSLPAVREIAGRTPIKADLARRVFVIGNLIGVSMLTLIVIPAEIVNIIPPEESTILQTDDSTRLAATKNRRRL